MASAVYTVVRQKPTNLVVDHTTKQGIEGGNAQRDAYDRGDDPWRMGCVGCGNTFNLPCDGAHLNLVTGGFHSVLFYELLVVRCPNPECRAFIKFRPPTAEEQRDDAATP